MPYNKTMKEAADEIKDMMTNNNRLRASLQKLQEMGFSEEESYCILSYLKYEAEQESPISENAVPAFNRRLKNINSGKYNQNKLHEILQSALPQDSAAHDQKAIDSMKRIVNFYGLNEYSEIDDDDFPDPEYVLELYGYAREILYDWLKEDIQNGRLDLADVTIHGNPVMDIINGLMDDLNDAGISGIKEAAALGDFINGSFTIGDSDDDGAYSRIKFLMHYADSLNALNRYKECDRIIDRLKAEKADKGLLYEEQVRVLRNRDYNAKVRADQLAARALNDEEFLDSDFNYGALMEFQDLFSEIDDQYNLDRVTALIEDRLDIDDLDDFDDDDYDDDDDELNPFEQEMAQTLVSLLASQFDKLFHAEDTPEEILEAKQYLDDLGYSDHEAGVLMAVILMLHGFSADEELSEEDIINSVSIVKHCPKGALDALLSQMDITFIHKLYRSLSFYYDIGDTEQAVDLLLTNMDELYDWIDEMKDVLETDDYEEFYEELVDDSVDFEDFISDSIEILEDEHAEELLSFSRHVLSTFDFTDDQTSTYANLKEAAAESMDKLGKHDQADKYIEQWQKNEPESTRPLWAKLWIYHNRGDMENGIVLADRVLSMDLAEDDLDSEVLLTAAEQIYEDANDKKRLKAVRKMMDEYGYEHD